MVKARRAPASRGFILLALFLVLLIGALYLLAGSADEVPVRPIVVEVDRNAAAAQ